ncbi:MAG: (5-formylfuran-3-yl)methyl phosphate synthase [Candidatus Bathyarchaeota archaeon]|nr:(5-formylfuran-3-yl)methyl phosphate synthase [Candidatus Bathyarchaeota archaeon]
MKLLISPKNKNEAIEAINGGANIIDVKNPSEGALGANFPWIIKEIIDIVPNNVETSCTIGEMPNLPGSISLAARGAASTGVNYIKAGLSGLKKPANSIKLMKCVVKAAKSFNSEIKVVITGYADAEKIDSVNPLLVPNIALKAHADVAMIDTAVKNGHGLFYYLNKEQVKNFVNISHKFKLKTALAGSLKIEELAKVTSTGTDIIGIRGAACTFEDRLNGKITRKKVQNIVNSLIKLKK